jgi:hypothetical protein
VAVLSMLFMAVMEIDNSDLRSQISVPLLALRD